MDTEKTKSKRDKAGCSCFKDMPADFEKMAEMMSRCCGSQDGSTMGKEKMKAMMEMCCGSRAVPVKP